MGRRSQFLVRERTDVNWQTNFPLVSDSPEPPLYHQKCTFVACLKYLNSIICISRLFGKIPFFEKGPSASAKRGHWWDGGRSFFILPGSSQNGEGGMGRIFMAAIRQFGQEGLGFRPSPPFPKRSEEREEKTIFMISPRGGIKPRKGSRGRRNGCLAFFLATSASAAEAATKHRNSLSFLFLLYDTCFATCYGREKNIPIKLPERRENVGKSGQ